MKLPRNIMLGNKTLANKTSAKRWLRSGKLPKNFRQVIGINQNVIYRAKNSGTFLFTFPRKNSHVQSKHLNRGSLQNVLILTLSGVAMLLRRTTTFYHPAANGLVERFHRSLKDFLKCQSKETLSGPMFSQSRS